MKRVPRIPSLEYPAIARLDAAILRGSMDRKARAMDRLRRRLRIPRASRGAAGLLDRLDSTTLLNLQPFPRVAAAVLCLGRSVPEYALFELDRAHPDAWAVRTLAEALGSVLPRFRSWIGGCFTHGNIGRGPALEILFRLLVDTRAQVRRQAARILEDHGARAVLMTPDLPRLAKDPIPVVRRLAQQWRGEIALDSIRSLALSLKEGGPRERDQAALLLRRHAEVLVEAVPRIVRSRVIRKRGFDGVANLLFRLREATYAVVPGFLRELGSHDRETSDAAMEALRANWRTSWRSRSSFSRCLGSPVPHVRANALRLLPLLGGAWDSSLGRLRTALRHPTPVVALAAAETLIRRAALSGEDRRSLEARLRAWDAASAALGAGLLAGTGKDTPRLLEPLLRGILHRDLRVRTASVDGLGRIRPVPRAARSALLRSLADRDVNVRHHALRALKAVSGRIRRDESDLRRIISRGDAGLRRKLRRWLPRGRRL